MLIFFLANFFPSFGAATINRPTSVIYWSLASQKHKRLTCVCVWSSQIQKKIVHRLRADRADDDNNKRKYIIHCWLIAVLTFDCNVNAECGVLIVREIIHLEVDSAIETRKGGGNTNTTACRMMSPPPPAWAVTFNYAKAEKKCEQPHYQLCGLVELSDFLGNVVCILIKLLSRANCLNYAVFVLYAIIYYGRIMVVFIQAKMNYEEYCIVPFAIDNFL